LKRREEANHETKGERANDGVNERDSRELNVAEVSDEDAGDRVYTELAPYVENNGQRDYPHSLRFDPEHLLNLLEAPRRHIVPVLRHQRRPLAVQQQGSLHRNHQTRVRLGFSVKLRIEREALSCLRAPVPVSRTSILHAELRSAIIK